MPVERISLSASPEPKTRPSDEQLVRAAQGGDRAAFADLVDRYKNLVCSIAFEITGSVLHSEDIGQDVFLRCWSRLAEFHEPLRFRSWICQIARNASLNFCRDQRSRGVRPGPGPRTGVDVASADPSPLDSIISREEEIVAWRALSQIPEPYRRALDLYYREEQSIRRVAKLLDVSELAIRLRLLRGRRMLEKRVLDAMASVFGGRSKRAFTAAVLVAVGTDRLRHSGKIPGAKSSLAMASAAAVLAVSFVLVIGALVWHRPAGSVPPGRRPEASFGVSGIPSFAAAARGQAAHEWGRLASDDGRAARDSFLYLDFEDGQQVALLDAGEVVAGFPCAPRSRFCVVASYIPGGRNPLPYVAVRSGPNRSQPLFRYSDRTVLAFDYWLGATGRPDDDLWLVIRNVDRGLNNFHKVVNPRHEEWTHVELSFADFRRDHAHGSLADRTQGIAAAPGDRFDDLGLWMPGDLVWSTPLYLDNIKISERDAAGR